MCAQPAPGYGWFINDKRAENRLDQGWGLTDINDLRVLVVDANAHIRRLIATLLDALSVKDVREARSPSAAVPMMLDRPPHLIIADFTGDSTELVLFVHRIRQGELIDAHTPVLAVAGSTHHAVLEQAWEAGIDEVIGRPISAVEMIRCAAQLLEAFLRRPPAVHAAG